MDAKIAAAAPFCRQPAAGATLNVLGVTLVAKATGGETAGQFSLWEAVVPPGAGAPPHAHAYEDEAFYVLSGELLVELEGEPGPVRAAPGAFVFGARGRRHAFRNVGDRPVRMLVLTTPSRGLDCMFAELDAATAAGAPALEQVTAIAGKYGVEIAAPAA